MKEGFMQDCLHVWSLSTGAVAPQIRQIVQGVDPYSASFAVVSLADEVSATLIRERLMAIFAVVFGGVVTVSIAVGLYGLTAFGVSRRTPEIGLRLAMGATNWDVYRLVVRNAAHVMVAGLAAVTALLVIATAASLVPARRAMRINPVTALRERVS